MANYSKRMCEQDAATILEWLRRNKIGSVRELLAMEESGRQMLVQITSVGDEFENVCSVRMTAFGAVFTLYDTTRWIDGKETQVLAMDNECEADDDGHINRGYAYVNMDIDRVEEMVEKALNKK